VTAWRKSSRCESHTCVEVGYADKERLVYVYASKEEWDPFPPMLEFDFPAWAAFLDLVRGSAFLDLVRLVRRGTA
jgi:hypothetical protein